ncbi:hypothetical protein [Streptomyces sp. NPDC047000]|uniref:hypothetical protein n=1 Tax=Streptomyces sp. NPDC047000 TaxID=3155474 RepID=UPI0033DD3EAF
MTEMFTGHEAAPTPVTALQMPYQTHAVDRNTTTSPGRGTDADGVEADFSWSDIPWQSLGRVAKGALDALL